MNLHVVDIGGDDDCSQPSKREDKPKSKRPNISRIDLRCVTLQSSIKGSDEELDEHDERNAGNQFEAGVSTHAAGVGNHYEPQQRTAYGSNQQRCPHHMYLFFVEEVGGHDRCNYVEYYVCQ